MEDERLRSERLIEIAQRAGLAIWRAATITIWVIRELLRTAWSIARGPVIATLNVIAALLVLFEEWGWRPLSNAIARLARFAPIAAVERLIAGLPPYAALVTIALPTALLLPLKFVAVWLLANNHFASATLLFLGAKLASTALIARVFILTKPALMRIAWFERAYNWFVPWKDAVFAQIRASWIWRYSRMLKTRMKIAVARLWVGMKPRLRETWQRWTGLQPPRVLRE